MNIEEAKPITKEEENAIFKQIADEYGIAGALFIDAIYDDYIGSGVYPDTMTITRADFVYALIEYTLNLFDPDQAADFLRSELLDEEDLNDDEI